MKIKRLLTLLLTVIIAVSVIAIVGCESGTKGLKYELSSDEMYYICLGFEEDAKIPSEVEIPSTYKGKPVQRIGAYAFRNEKDIEKIIISDGVERIGASAFNGCTNLVEVVLPNTLKQINTKAFGESGVKKLVLPNSLEELSSGVFRDANDLEEVILGDGVQEIGSNVFDSCKSLKKVTLGKGLKKIDTYAFLNCTALEQITIPKGVRAIYGGAFTGCDNLTYMLFEGVSMTECTSPKCGVGICPATKEEGFSKHYHSNYWFNSENPGSAFGHYHWIFSHDLGDPNQAYKYFVTGEAKAMHNHALGGQGDYWEYNEEADEYTFDGEAYFKYGNEMLDVDDDIRGWIWYDSTEFYWFNGTKGEY